MTIPDSARPDSRIAYLINQYPKVSHTFIRREILALERQGFTVLRFALRGWDADLVDSEDEAERGRTRYILQAGLWPLVGAVARNFIKRPRAAFGALVAALAMSRKSVRPWPYHLVWFAHACQLRLWLETDPVQHLHAHFGTNSTDVAYLLRLLGGPTYSFTVHGADEFDNARSCSFPRKVGAARFAVAVSHFTRAQLMRSVTPTDWAKLHVVHCGLAEDFFADKPAAFPAKPVVLCIGRLCAEKGHHTLLEAFAALKRPEVKLVLAGDGEFRKMIEDRIAALGLGNQVSITGWISGDEVRRRIIEATIVVQPSLMEGLPVVIMEAMAQARPVVSTFIAGIPELVQDGITGWLVPAGDSESLSRALAVALDTSDDHRTAMGKAGALRVRERHHVDTEAAKLAGLFTTAGEP